MQRSSFSKAVWLLAFFFLAQSPDAGMLAQSAGIRDQQAQDRDFLARRENFTSGRELLLTKRVPFDPDELLRDGWPEKLKNSLDSMPEMHESRYEREPLKGAYLADTLYLPETVHVSGHTIILANYVVFEGTKPVIKGNFDIHFFPVRPVSVLGKSLSEVLKKNSGLLNVGLRGKFTLPSFSLLKDAAQPGSHVITLDASGPKASPAQKIETKPGPLLRSASWSTTTNSALMQKQCTVSCSNNGTNGNPGTLGTAGTPGMPGPSPPKEQNGSCSGSFNGIGGDPGGDGEGGSAGGPGGPGEPGNDSGGINATIADNDTNKYVFIADGGDGGRGGDGGPGGNGGAGGNGGEGGDGVACNCQLGEGGDGGHGGNGGKGGAGGTGGNGGNGGRGGVITVSLPFNGTLPDVSNLGGHGAGVGSGGTGGQGGTFGAPGNPGKGATDCGHTAVDGRTSSSGSPGAPGAAGGAGAATGQNGPPGPPTNPTRRPATTTGGVGITDPCLGGSGSDGGSSFTGPVAPTCSPVIIDTTGEGFALTSAQGGVKFDISGTGHPIQLAWTAPGSHDAFLSLPGPDGLIHNGKELFGNFTPQPQSAHSNGFLALAQFDRPENGGNDDGIIDEHDAVFGRLRLWIDENHDGICQPDELHTLPELGVFSLSLKYHESRRTDNFGNQFRYRAKVNPLNDGDSEVGRWGYDVFLTVAEK